MGIHESHKTATEETSFALAFGHKVVVPAEIEATTHQTEHFEENENHNQICLNLDLLASKRPAAYQQRVARYYNRKLQVRQLRQAIGYLGR